jgi:hypothetical protein
VARCPAGHELAWSYQRRGCPRCRRERVVEMVAAAEPSLPLPVIEASVDAVVTSPAVLRELTAALAADLAALTRGTPPAAGRLTSELIARGLSHAHRSVDHGRLNHCRAGREEPDAAGRATGNRSLLPPCTVLSLEGAGWPRSVTRRCSRWSTGGAAAPGDGDAGRGCHIPAPAATGLMHSQVRRVSRSQAGDPRQPVGAGNRVTRT